MSEENANMLAFWWVSNTTNREMTLGINSVVIVTKTETGKIASGYIYCWLTNYMWRLGEAEENGMV